MTDSSGGSSMFHRKLAIDVVNLAIAVLHYGISS